MGLTAVPDEVPDEVLESVISAGARLRAAGLSPGSTGNLSRRVGGLVVCTATGTDLGDLTVDDLAIMQVTGELIGAARPSKEVAMHLAAYRADPSAEAVVHTHARHATAVSCLRDLDPDDAIPAVTPYLTMRVGPIAVVGYRPPGDPELGALVGGQVSRGARGLLLANHGTLVLGSCLDDAVSATSELEESCALHLLLAAHDHVRLSGGERSRSPTIV